MRRPLVILPACHKVFGGYALDATPEVYSQAVRLTGCQPLLATAGQPGEFETLLELADGILLPGSPNNVHPSHFGEEVHNLALPLDPQRDGLSLPLVREAIARGIPLLGICRGHQEMNVAMGGSLHQALREQPGWENHPNGPESSPEAEFAPIHEIHVTPSGLLEQCLGPGPFMVNSAHDQSVNRLAPGARIEAVATDGVIEAIHFPDAPGFNLGIQWHPEWQAATNPVSLAIFRAFGDACAHYHITRSTNR